MAMGSRLSLLSSKVTDGWIEEEEEEMSDLRQFLLFDQLPMVVIHHIFSYLSFGDRLRAERVNRLWRSEMVWPRTLTHFAPPLAMDRWVRDALVRKLTQLGRLRAASEFHTTCYKRWPYCMELRANITELWVSEGRLNMYIWEGNPNVTTINVWTSSAGSLDDGPDQLIRSFVPLAHLGFMKLLMTRWCPQSLSPFFNKVYTVCFDCLPEHLVWWRTRFPNLQRITVWRNAECLRSSHPYRRHRPEIFGRACLCPFPDDMRKLMTDPAAVQRLETTTLSHTKVVPTADEWEQMQRCWNWLFLEILNIEYQPEDFNINDNLEDFSEEEWADHRRRQLLPPYGLEQPDRVT